jgi:hypothetical protein
MAGDAMAEACPPRKLRRWFAYCLILGLYLTLRGYHSFDGDQAYRLPLLLHRQNPQLYANDPFVRAFDGFNPHRGALAVLDLVSRPLGLPAGLLILFFFTFGTMCLGVDRLARAAWPEAGENVGLLAIGLILAAKAGNIGTNHLFEAMVLDRLMAFALAWLALAEVVADPQRRTWRAPGAIGLATLIHPSVGLQLAMLLGACWVTWSLLGRGTGAPFPVAIRGVASLVAAVVPGLAVNFDTASALLNDMPADVFWLLSVELQSPQHMLPHLWRMPQWLAWTCYLVLGGLACVMMTYNRSSLVHPPLPPLIKGGKFLGLRVATKRVAWKCRVQPTGIASSTSHLEGSAPHLSPPQRGARRFFPQPPQAGRRSKWNDPPNGGSRSKQESRTGNGNRVHTFVNPPLPPARLRLIIALALILAGLAVAWFLVEIRHHAQVTVFQPFRMATVARGLALLLVAGRLVALWQRDTWLGRLRALLMAVGFIGNWLLVVVTLAELAVSIVETIRSRTAWFQSWNFVDAAVFFMMIALGLNFLGHHDTEYGHVPLLAVLCSGLLIAILRNRGPVTFLSRLLRRDWTALQLGGALAIAWLVPLTACLAAAIPWNHPWSRHPLVTTLLCRCRFVPVPVDDVERLALWCRENTPGTASFIGPPGPKTFRLWSQRALAFNRSASPYHAAGLADWYARFQDHVDFHAAPAEFVRTYVRDRHRFEARYEEQSDVKRAALAIGQGASYVVAAAPAAKAREHGSPHRLNQKRIVPSPGPLELLHVEGRYAVYRVKLDALVQRQR